MSKILVRLKMMGQNGFQEIQYRVTNFKEVWNEIIDRWLVSNEAKFEKGRGAQLSGVEFDAGDDPVRWMGVTDEYAADKSADGYPNWLMVRTGELKKALTERGATDWQEALNPMETLFGTIEMGSFGMMKAIWHRKTRPVIFLSTDDRQMIRDMIGAWFNGDPPFRKYAPSEVESYDAVLQTRMTDLPGV